MSFHRSVVCVAVAGLVMLGAARPASPVAAASREDPLPPAAGLPPSEQSLCQAASAATSPAQTAPAATATATPTVGTAPPKAAAPAACPVTLPVFIPGVAFLLLLWLAYTGAAGWSSPAVPKSGGRPPGKIGAAGDRIVRTLKAMATTWNLAKVFDGADGNASTSKFQFYVWTLTLFYTYITVYVANLFWGWDTHEVLSTFPPTNLLIVSGVTIVTLGGARVITGDQVAHGTVQKPSPPAPANAAAGAGAAASGVPAAPAAPAAPPAPTAARSGRGLAALFQDDGDNLDIGKVQLLGWTAIAVVTFLIQLFQSLSQIGPYVLPDVPGALLPLMGFGHLAYLGNKLVTTDTLALTGVSVSPGAETKRPTLTLYGNAFGEAQQGSQITFDQNPIPVVLAGGGWSDSKVEFEAPATQPSGAAWATDRPVVIGVLVGTQKSNPLPFTFTAELLAQAGEAPELDAIDPPAAGAAAPNLTVVLHGKRLGASQGFSVVTFDCRVLPGLTVKSWADDKIELTLPADRNGAAWVGSAPVQVGVIVAGRPCAKEATLSFPAH